MHCLVGRDREEIVDEFLSHLLPESSGHVEREIDRDEFDMREAVPQRDARPIRSEFAPLGHPVRWQQFGRIGPCRPVGHGDVKPPGQRAPAPRPRDIAGGEAFGARPGGEQRGTDRCSNALHGSRQRGVIRGSGLPRGLPRRGP